MMFCASSCYGGETHLLFKGVEMNGSGENFVEKLEKQGYVLLGKSENIFLMEGQYGGTQCQIGVIETPKTHKVATVMVMFPEQKNWSDLKKQFETMEYAFTKKYGTPFSTSASFKHPYYDGDGWEMSSVRFDKSDYHALYKVGDSTIFVLISNKRCVGIDFSDGINKKILEKEKSEIEMKERQYQINDI